MADWDDDERAALVALLRARPHGWSWPEIAAEVAQVGSALDVWRSLGSDTLFDAEDREAGLAGAAADVAAWRAAPFAFLTFPDPGYPSRLRDVHQFPPVLFTRGDCRPDETGVSVVGSRRASEWGLRFAAQTAEALAADGIAVLSGLASGVDTSAHTAALAAGGRTVAVLGTGIQQCYPAENRALQDRIARHGLLLSQFWPDAPPARHSFPMRNAVMSAYGHATLVVEAGETSGARIQARVAVEHGRPVLLTEAVVGSTKWGSAMVGRPGVTVVGSVEDALEAVRSLLQAEGRVTDLLSRATV